MLDLELAPLRDRGEDVQLLGLEYFRRLCGGETTAEQEKRYLDMLAQVRDYAWYGNIRELQNFTERVHILLENGNEVGSGVMTEIMRRRSAGAPQPRRAPAEETDSRERSAIEAALRNYPDSMEDAAKSLGCSRQTLWRKMKKFGITRP